MDDFNTFFDSVVLQAASKQSGERERMISIPDQCREIKGDVSADWIRHATSRIKELNLGNLIRDNEKHSIFHWALNGTALSYASNVAKARKPPSFTDYLATEKFNRLSTLAIALLSLAMSGGALFVSYLAYPKSH